MKVSIDMGLTRDHKPATLDLEELLATRLLVQGNSGSGKSHLLRRLVEQSAQWVQQCLVDPEGDYVTLAEEFGHVVVDAAEHNDVQIAQIAARVRQHRISVVLNLENLEAEFQLRRAAAFLNGMFDADRDHWYPCLVVVDEAQLFAPVAGGDVTDEARKQSLGAMTNLMCRGRKRGLAGVIATQRLAKLAKNVAAEASNFLMGRTFLDIDMVRAADLLGMDRRQAEMFRDLERGNFIALGPAMSRRPLPVRIGDVKTGGRGGSPKLMPLPETAPEEARDLIMTPGENEPPPPLRKIRPLPPQTATNDVLTQLAQARPPEPEADEEDDGQPVDPAVTIERIMREVIADPDAAFRSTAVLYQDFLVRCRMKRINGRQLDLAAFKRKLATARAGVSIEAEHSENWDKAQAVADRLPEDLQPLFLLLARAAMDQTPCPSDTEIARARNSRSPRRARGLLEYLESRGVITQRESQGGLRVIALPDLEWETAPGDPEAGEETSGGQADLFGIG